MDVLLLGASGRLGSRIATELLDRGHAVTGVSRSGDVEGVDDPDFETVAGDARDADRIAELAEGHDAVASALGPSEDEDAEDVVAMAEAVLEALDRSGVDRLLWIGGAGSLRVDDDTLLIETPDFPDEVKPVSAAHMDALELFREREDLDWTFIVPAAIIEPGERTGEYRTSEGELVTDEEGDSYITMEDFAVAYVDELESGGAIHTKLGVGY